MIPNRPTSLTPEMALRAALSVASDLEKDGSLDETTVEDAARDIAQHGRSHMDGYELAKTLDHYAHWDCDLPMSEALDGFSSAARWEIEEAQKQWAEDNKIEPPLPIGARVIARWGGKDCQGIIEEIYEHGAAKYCVKRDDETGSYRMLVNFEDVREAQP